MIAQDVETVLPELVHTDNDGYKSLSYDKLTAVLVKAVNEQQTLIRQQQHQLTELTTKISELRRAAGLE